MKPFSHQTFLALATFASASAQAATSAHFTIIHDETAGGGGRSSSARFEIVSSVNAIATTGGANTASFTHRLGYIGQLNEFPLLLQDQLVARPSRTLKVLKTTLLANDRDADDASLRFIGVPALSANSVPLSIIGDWVFYDAPQGNTFADSFTYTVSDGIDESIGRVNLSNSLFDGITLNIVIVPQGDNILLRVFGIPGHPYQIQSTVNVNSPIVWSNLGAVEIAPANGLIQRIDSALPAPRFYRAIEP